MARCQPRNANAAPTTPYAPTCSASASAAWTPKRQCELSQQSRRPRHDHMTGAFVIRAVRANLQTLRIFHRHALYTNDQS